VFVFCTKPCQYHSRDNHFAPSVPDDHDSNNRNSSICRCKLLSFPEIEQTSGHASLLRERLAVWGVPSMHTFRFQFAGQAASHGQLWLIRRQSGRSACTVRGLVPRRGRVGGSNAV
jgi:hypothetical protein